MNTEKEKAFSFRHAYKQGTSWVNGPWMVEGPSFSIQIDDRTEAALLARKLNEAWPHWKKQETAASSQDQCKYCAHHVVVHDDQNGCCAETDDGECDCPRFVNAL